MTRNKVDEDPELKTITPIVEQFIADTGYVLWFDDGQEGPWNSDKYQISWPNSHGCSCCVLVIPTKPGYFMVSCLCWGIHSLLGKKNWPVTEIDRAEAELRSTMNDAVEWAEGFQQEA